MHKHLLSQQEIEELLYSGDQEPSPALSEESEGRETSSAQEEIRGEDHKEMAIRYLQQTVQELLGEVADLRRRLEKLERAGAAGKEDFDAGASAEAPKVEKGEPAAIPSRAERHRAQRGKWF
ncbi:hypothetical protein [Cohnella candidum]|uniref:Uncharacterized protein n=1 Tax=Cohnella candidum TaxID=2674991 RepID=A0A3G3JTF1_9BACL|nr:hypothetical protein [Cohnella candidum]AYQ71482.1 hypothetical protein EAV92_02110 [Cohnella candidum]